MRIAQRKESPIIGLSGMGGGLASYILYGGSGSSVYEISRSLRFNNNDSAYLSKTSDPDPDGNRKQWTWSGWVKRSGLGVQYIWGNGDSGANYGFMLRFESSDAIGISDWGASPVWRKVTTGVFRDVSAWYHIVVSYDTTNATDTERVKLYVNGSRITEFTTNTHPDEMYSGFTNDGSPDRIGRWGEQDAYYLNGYLADLHFVDGGALTADDFGETDEYGIWNPKEFTGDHNVTNTPSSYPAVYVTSKPTYGSVANLNTSSGAFTSNSGQGAGSVKVVFDSAITGVTHVKFQGGGYSVSAVFDIKINGSTVLSNLSTVSGYGEDTEALGAAYDITSFEIVSDNDGWALFNLRFSTNGTDYTYPSGTPSVNEKSGLNGWHLKFDDNTSTTTLGADSSGNSNAWTLNNFSVASGSDNDSLLDSPTNYSASSGNNGGNYATLNQLDSIMSAGTISAMVTDGNLTKTNVASTYGKVRATMPVHFGGKTYFEVTCGGSPDSNDYIGFEPSDLPIESASGFSSGVLGFRRNATLSPGGSSYGGSWTSGDVIGFYFDYPNQIVGYYLNGVDQGTAYSSFDTRKHYLPTVQDWSNAQSGIFHFNFGQRPFVYTPPTDHLALCTQNLPTPSIQNPSEQIGITTYASDGNATSITGLSFSPDLVWQKQTTGSDRHFLTNSVRGAGLALRSDEDFLEGSTDAVASFTSDGWTIAAGAANANQNSQTYVGWTWNAGANSNRTYNVTVVSDSGNKYRFNGHGTSAVTLELEEGSTYVFDSSDSSVDSHPFVLGTSANSDEYSTGVTYTLDGTNVTYSAYTSGFASATTRKLTITVPASAPTLYYWCSVHSGMGGQINTNATTGSSVLSGSLNSEIYTQDAVYSGGTVTGATYSGFGWANAFDTNFSNAAAGNGPTNTTTIDLSSFSITANAGEIVLVFNSDVTSNTYWRFNGVTPTTSNTSMRQTGNGYEFTLTSATSLTGITLDGASQLTGVFVAGKRLIDSDESITTPTSSSVVRANQTAGFSLVKWEGDSTAQTIAHGLSGEPSLIFMKDLDNNAYWRVYHNGGDFTTTSSGAFSPFYHWRLDNDSSRLGSANDAFTNTRPTNTHFSVAANANTGGTKGMIAYCWQEIEGYSKFGDYTGNTTSTPFVYTGFKPAVIIIKTATSTGNWHIYDTERANDNLAAERLFPNLNNVEQNSAAGGIDILSNGFKLKNNSAGLNANGVVHLYMAWAEHPLKNTRAR